MNIAGGAARAAESFFCEERPFEPELGNPNVGKRTRSLSAGKLFVLENTVLIMLNGVATNIPDSATIQDIIRINNYPEETAIIALNDEVIKRDLWQKVHPKADDRLEVIRIIGGG